MSYGGQCIAQQGWPQQVGIGKPVVAIPSMLLCESTHLERQLISPLFALSLTLYPALGELEVGLKTLLVLALRRLQVCLSVQNNPAVKG